MRRRRSMRSVSRRVFSRRRRTGRPSLKRRVGFRM